VTENIGGEARLVASGQLAVRIAVWIVASAAYSMWCPGRQGTPQTTVSQELLDLPADRQVTSAHGASRNQRFLEPFVPFNVTRASPRQPDYTDLFIMLLLRQ